MSTSSSVIVNQVQKAKVERGEEVFQSGPLTFGDTESVFPRWRLLSGRTSMVTLSVLNLD